MVEANKVYKGELEKLQEEYLARKKKEDEIQMKRNAIMEENRDMARRQMEKDKLKKEVKALRFKQSRTGQTINAVKDVTKRSWAITKNVGKGLSVAGGSIMGALGGNSPQPTQNVPVRQTVSPRKVLQPARPAFDFESFENQIISGGGVGMQSPAQPMSQAMPRMRSRTTYRKVKEKIRVKRGRKWVTKTVTRKRKVNLRVPRINRIPRIPPAPTQNGFDLDGMLKGMPS